MNFIFSESNDERMDAVTKICGGRKCGSSFKTGKRIFDGRVDEEESLMRFKA